MIVKYKGQMRASNFYLINFCCREWRDRISAWFVDLENGGENQRRPPPRRFQHRLHLDSVDPSSRGLATLPEGETGQEDSVIPPVSNYQRVYRDRRPSVKLN